MATATNSGTQVIEKHNAALQRLMVAYDFSAFSDSALGCALTIADSFRSEIILVYASADVGGRDGDLHGMKSAHSDASEELDNTVGRIRGRGLRCRSICRIGSPEDVLSQVAAEVKPDLLILGAYGRRAGVRARLGSTAEFILRSIPCAILTIGPLATFDRGFAWRISAILYVSSHTADSSAAMELTATLAVAAGACVDVASVLPSETQQVINISELNAIGNSVAAALRRHGIQACSNLLHPPAARSILERAQAIGAGLIVIGNHGRRLDERGLRTITEILRGATCPVLTMPGPA